MTEYFRTYRTVRGFRRAVNQIWAGMADVPGLHECNHVYDDGTREIIEIDNDNMTIYHYSSKKAGEL